MRDAEQSRLASHVLGFAVDREFERDGRLFAFAAR